MNKQQLDAVSRSLRANVPVVADVSAAAHLPGDTALLVIDVQPTFCAPHGEGLGDSTTDRFAQQISTIIPEFRKAGMPVYVVHYTGDLEVGARDITGVKFHRFQPDFERDTTIRKTGTSAFDGTRLHDTLQKDGRRNLLACGFCLSACVMDTLMDALDKQVYRVTLLEDLSADPAYYHSHRDNTLHAMESQNIRIESSARALAHAKALKNGR